MQDEGMQIQRDVEGEVVVAKRGDVVFVESRRDLTKEQMAAIGRTLAAACDKYGIQIIVLPPFLKVARGVPRPIDPNMDTGTPGVEPDAGGTGEHTKEGP